MELAVYVTLLALGVYWWLIIAEVISSWIPSRPGQPRWLVEARSFIHALTEPYLGLFHRFIPALRAGNVGIDFTPLIGLIVLSLLRGVVGNLV